MKLSEMLVSGAVAAWASAAIAGVTGYYSLKAISDPAKAEAAQTSSSWWGTGHWRRQRTGHAVQWCEGKEPERSLAALTPYVEADLKLDGQQKAAWSDLAGEGDRVLVDLHRSFCSQPEGTAPEALATLRRALAETGLAVETVEAKLQSFYDSLDTAQRARLDSYLNHRIGGR